MDKPEQVKALENGKGIQYLLNCAYKIFNNPFYVIDANYNLLGFNDVPMDDHIWSELITTGTFSMEAQEFLAKESFIENFVNSNKNVILKSDKLKYRRLSGPIFIKGDIIIGLVAMYEYSVPFDTESMAAFDILAKKITEEIKDYEYFITLVEEFHETKISKLLDGVINNPLIYNPQAQFLYEGFEDYLYLAVVSIPRNNIRDIVHRTRLSYFKSLLKTRYKSFKYSVYADYIVMLMSSKDKSFYKPDFFSADADIFEQNDLFMGVSGSFENIYELRVYYDQAVAALTNGLADKEDMRIFLHNSA